MSKRNDGDVLRDIQEAVRRIVTYTSGMTFDAFLADPKTQDAVVRNLEIIGEATKNLSDEIRSQNPRLPWKGMAGMRDRLIHHYFGVNIDIVWQIVTAELPDVACQIEEMRRKA